MAHQPGLTGCKPPGSVAVGLAIEVARLSRGQATQRGPIMGKQRILQVMGLALGLVLATQAQAAVPQTVQMEAALQSTAGGPAVDGDYLTTFALFQAETAGKALWTEGPTIVTAKAGHFTWTLGSKTPLPPQLLQGSNGLWIEVTIGNDAPLPRRPVASVVFALRAALAEALDCTGCVGAAQIDAKALADFAKTANLAKVATSGSFLDLTNLPQLSGVALSGNYSDLNGKPVLAKLGTACGSGLFVRGLNADGSLDCAPALDPKALPANGLGPISNGLLSNVFEDSFASAKPATIPDNSPAGVTDSLEVPDVGLAQQLLVSIDLSNSDISTLKVVLTDPAGATYVLWDKGGPGKQLKLTVPAPDKTVSGDLLAWIGKNAKGTWKLTATDSGFLANGNDGQINAWSVQIQTLSNQKVQAKGALLATGGLQVPIADKPPTCDAVHAGWIYFNPSLTAFYGCTGKTWVSMSDSGNSKNCADLLVANPQSPSGVYTIDADGGGPAVPVDVYCDMTSEGGGWTMLVRLDTNDTNSHIWSDTGFWNANSGIGDVKAAGDYLSAAYAVLTFTQVRLVYSYQGPAQVAASYGNVANTDTLRKNLNLTLSNSNPAWNKLKSSSGLADEFFGPVLRFQTTGNDNDYNRIWYNLVDVAACNQGGSIGAIGDFGGGAWNWEVARGSSLDPSSCQHNTYRLGLGANYDKKAWGGNDVQPTAFYNQGVMQIFVK